MNETTRIVAHYLETIVARAGLRGFDEIRAELEAADEADASEREKLEARVKELEREVARLGDELGSEINRIEKKVDAADQSDFIP